MCSNSFCATATDNRFHLRSRWQLESAQHNVYCFLSPAMPAVEPAIFSRLTTARSPSAVCDDSCRAVSIRSSSSSSSNNSSSRRAASLARQPPPQPVSRQWAQPLVDRITPCLSSCVCHIQTPHMCEQNSSIKIVMLLSSDKVAVMLQ